MESSSYYAGDKETQVEEEEQDGSDDDRNRVMALAVLSTHTETKIINTVPLGVKHPILLYTVGIREGNKLMWAFKRTNDLWTHFISFDQMLYFVDSDDVCTLWKLYKEKYGDNAPTEVYERVIYYMLKVMFEKTDGDLEWKILKAGKVLNLYLY